MPIPTGSFSVIPLKNTVIFPGVTQAIKVGREKSIKAVDIAAERNNWILTLTQKNSDLSAENIDNLYDIGTLAKIESIKTGSEGGYYLVVRGYYRVRVSSFKPETEILEAFVERLDDIYDVDKTTERALLASLKQVSLEVLRVLPGNTEPVQEVLEALEDISLLSHMAAANAELSLSEKQNILECIAIKERIMTLLTLLQRYKENLVVQQDIRQKLNKK